MSLCQSWATADDLPETCSNDAVTPTTLDAALRFASDVLYNLTRRRYRGECTDTFHPFGCAGCWSSGCASSRHFGLELPGQPVRAITSVVIDGVEIDPSEYYVVGERYLRRLSGSWPCGCNLNDLDRFVVTYTYGRTPTPSLVRAAAILGWEFALAWTPSCAGACRLPRRVTSVTRQGVSFAVVDPLTLFKDGLTGVPEVDMLIQSELYGEGHRRAAVYVPDRGPMGFRS